MYHHFNLWIINRNTPLSTLKWSGRYEHSLLEAAGQLLISRCDHAPRKTFEVTMQYTWKHYERNSGRLTASADAVLNPKYKALKAIQ